jgi:hypothetical protein
VKNERGKSRFREPQSAEEIVRHCVLILSVQCDL